MEGDEADFIKSQLFRITGTMYITVPADGLRFPFPPGFEKVGDNVYKDVSNRSPAQNCTKGGLKGACEHALKEPYRVKFVELDTLPKTKGDYALPESIHQLRFVNRLWIMSIPTLAGNDAILDDADQPPPPPPNTGFCLVDAVVEATKRSRKEVWDHLLTCPDFTPPPLYSGFRPAPLTHNHLRFLAKCMEVRFKVHAARSTFVLGDSPHPCYDIFHSPNHWSAEKPVRSPVMVKKPRGHVNASPVQQHLFQLCRSYSRSYRISMRRAKITLEDIANRNLGVALRDNQEFLSKARSLIDCPPRSTQRHITVAGILGEGGTGKSHDMIQILASRYQHYPEDEDWCIIAPTAKLRNQIKNDLGLRPGHGYRVKTWETAFLERLPSTVIFDDCGLFPAFDLLLAVKPSIKDVFFTGEPGQGGMSVSPNTGGWAECKPMVDLVAYAACTFKRDNYRLGSKVAEKLGVESVNPHEGDIFFSTSQFSSQIVATRGMVQTAAELQREAYTPVTCQGHTLDLPEIVIDSNMRRADDKAVYTMLYRSRGNLLINLPHKPKNLQPSSRILKAIIIAKEENNWEPLYQAVRDHRIRYTPRHLQDPLRMPGKKPPPLEKLLFKPLSGWGTDRHPYNETVRRQIAALRPPPTYKTSWDHVWTEGRARRSIASRLAFFLLMPWLYLSYHLGFADPKPADPAPSPPARDDLSSHFTLCAPPVGYSTYEIATEPSVMAAVSEMLFPSRVFGREVRISGEMTHQVDDSDEATAIFLRHRRDDKATEAWTFKERMVGPRAPVISYLGGAQQLLAFFEHVYEPKYPQYNQDIWDECYDEDLDNFLDKGLQGLKNIAYRSDPSLDPGKAEIFLKGQAVTKPGTAYRDAKKGQMITGFPTIANARFGALARYIYRAMRTALPPHILLLNGITLDQQEEWYQKYWDFTKMCYGK